MEQHLQAIVTVLSLVNPLICGAMFAQIEAGQTRATRLADATKAALAVLVILLVAALAGARVLQVFGVSLDAFSVAGGGVLTWIGFSMLRGNSAQVARSLEAWRCRETIAHAVDPVRGQPGHDYRSHHARRRRMRSWLLPVTALVAVVVATVVMWIVMVLVSPTAGSRAKRTAFCTTR